MARVLIIDDEDDVRSMLVLALESEGYEVDEAEDGPTGLAMLRDGDYDLVVLDVMMPGMSGRAVAREIRRDPELRSTPIVMLTALTGERNTWKGWRSGVDVYLSKPVDLVSLRAHIGRLLRDGGEWGGGVPFESRGTSRGANGAA